MLPRGGDIEQCPQHQVRRARQTAELQSRQSEEHMERRARRSDRNASLEHLWGVGQQMRMGEKQESRHEGLQILCKYGGSRKHDWIGF